MRICRRRGNCKQGRHNAPIVQTLDFICKLSLLATLLTLAHISKYPPTRSLPSSALILKAMTTPGDAGDIAGSSSSSASSSNRAPRIKPIKAEDILDRINFDKQDEFPALVEEQNGVLSRIPAADATPWLASVEDWAASKGFPGLTDFTNTMTSISEDGSKFEPHPNISMEPTVLESYEGRKNFLARAATTQFGRYIRIPIPADSINEHDAHVWMSAISQISWQLAYRLKHSASGKGKLISLLPDIIDNPGSLGHKHPLKGFIMFRQIAIKLKLDPQGTTLQMKEQLLSEIRGKGTDDKFTLWDLSTFLDQVNSKLSNIIQRQPGMKNSLEMEIISCTSSLALKICRKTIEDKHTPDEAHSAALHIQHAMVNLSAKLQNMSWMDYQLSTANTLLSYLPIKNGGNASPAVAAAKSAIALVGRASTNNRQAHQHQQSAHNGYSKDDDWTCERCGGKGHRRNRCKNPPNPDAPFLVEQAKEEATKRRLERMEKAGKRRNITRNQQAQAETMDGDRQAGPTSSKIVHSNLSVLSSASGERQVYRTCAVATVTKGAPALPTILMLLGCLLAALIGAMTTGTSALMIIAVLCFGMIAIPATTSTAPTRLSPHNFVSVVITAIVFLLLATNANAYIMPSVALTAGNKALMHDNRHTVWIDSGCTKTIFCNPAKLQNLKPPDDEYLINGVGGYIKATQMGDFHMALEDTTGQVHIRVIKDCLLAPDAPGNLLSTQDLRAAGVGFEVPANPTQPASINITEAPGQKISFSLQEKNGLFMLPFYRNIMTEWACIVSHQLRSLTESELWHCRLNHAGSKKIAQLSKNCIGIKNPLAEHPYPCHICQEAKATKQDYPTASDHSGDEDILAADSLDMGVPTQNGNTYLTIFSIVKTRYVMIFLHKSKKDFPVLLKKALAQMGRVPKILRTDGAGEETSAELSKICLDLGIQQQHSNPYEQFGNAIPEKMVDTIDQQIRVTLLDANLPTKMWGYAAINAVDVYNHLPHSALGNKTPWECEKGTLPDVSWFRPMGCRATVYIGSHPERLWHNKLAARGEACVYLGLGMSQGLKGWLCWNPEIDRIYCTRNVVFDETFMPLRPHDQRILGHYDSTPRTRLAKAAHGTMDQAAAVASDIHNMPTAHGFEPLDSVSDDEIDEVARLPAGRLHHDEADGLITELQDTSL